MQVAAESDQVWNDMNALVDALLLTIDDDSVEVAHEALVREWPRFRSWLDDDRELLVVHRHLTDAARGWDAMDRDPGELYLRQL